MAGHLLGRLFAEAMGTAGTTPLIAPGPGSAVAVLLRGKGRLDHAGTGFISLSSVVIVLVVIYAFGSGSGARANPAVTIALAVGRRFSWREVPDSPVAQFVGGFRTAAIFGGRPSGADQLSDHVESGTFPRSGPSERGR
jgi:glycerol uptake facilitator-like aquaporin